MSTRKKQLPIKIDSKSNYNQIKEEVLLLITGQNTDGKADFDYMKLVKRVTVILVAVYGISRVSILRQLALSIATTLFTRWVAQRALDTAVAVSA